MRPLILLLLVLTLCTRVAFAQSGETSTVESAPASCEGGRVEPVGHPGRCCWPDQTWHLGKGRCVSEPACPDGLVAEGESCVEAPTCAQGRKRSADTGGRCCWPGQVFERGRGCVGVPSSCEAGLHVEGESCVSDRPSSCEQGQVSRPEGLCCWPGQDIVINDGQPSCRGVPTCPSGMVLQGESCLRVNPLCPQGMLGLGSALAPTCCWPGQIGEEGRCSGAPDECPSGTQMVLQSDSGRCELDQEVGWTDLGGGAFVMEREVSVELYEQIVGEVSLTRSQPGEFPVLGVSWLDAVRFANLLSRLEGLAPAYTVKDREVVWNPSADGYRLPTDAEWYALALRSDACREEVWDARRAEGRPRSVETSDVAGADDLCGNAWEWVWTGEPASPYRALLGRDQVARGGCWASSRANPESRLEFSGRRGSDVVGFRLYRGPAGDEGPSPPG